MAIASIEKFMQKRGINALCIDSETFRGLSYILIGKEIILYSGSCGTFDFNIRNWDELKQEIDDIIAIYYNKAEVD